MIKFYSTLLDKTFDTADECLAAEAKYPKNKTIDTNIDAARNQMADAYQDLQGAERDAKEILIAARKTAKEIIEKAVQKTIDAQKHYNDLIAHQAKPEAKQYDEELARCLESLSNFRLI